MLSVLLILFFSSKWKIIQLHHQINKKVLEVLQWLCNAAKYMTKLFGTRHTVIRDHIWYDQFSQASTILALAGTAHRMCWIVCKHLQLLIKFVNDVLDAYDMYDNAVYSGVI